MPVLCRSLPSCLESVGVTRFFSLAGGWLRKPAQMPGSLVWSCSIVAAKDALALELVELAAQVLGGQEDGCLDPRDALRMLRCFGGPLELALELLRLLVGEVQRVLDRPGLAVIAEQPG